MPRYNLAYYPVQKDFAETCIDFAARHFTALADGYLLNAEHAHPHITLAQFYADEARISELWGRAMAMNCDRQEITLMNVAFRDGTGIHKGYVWAELEAKRDQTLVYIQSRLVAWLKEAGINSLTESWDAYHPHLTFARLTQKPESVPEFRDIDLKRPHSFQMSLGAANEYGVYLRVIHPH